MKMIIKGAMLMALLATLAGCAMSRSEVDLAGGSTPLPVTAQPAQGTAVKIVSVDDQRVFKVDPKTPHEPSLKDDDIANKDVTSRAIGRKRNGWGEALGDVLLPKGDSVSARVGAALADGFRQAGYRVLTSGDAGYDQAVPVTAIIKQYWSWEEIGLALKLNCRAEIKLDSALPALTPSQTILSQAEQDEALIVDSDWRKINNQGLQALSKEVAETLKAKGSG